jgi:MFS family permease
VLKVLYVAVAAGIVLRVLFLALSPLEGDSVVGRLSAYNDESAHFHYIMHIANHGNLPGKGDSIPEDAKAATFENFQSPLYYLLCTPFVALWQSVNPSAGYFAARIISLIASIALVPLAFSIARMFGFEQTAAASAAMVTAILGSFVRFGSLVSNDALCWLFGGLAVYFWLKTERDAPTSRHFLLWSLAMIASIFTKLSALLLLPLPFLSSVLERRWRQSLRWLLCSLVVLAAALPIWLRNIQDFGSLLPFAAGFGEPGAGQASWLSVAAYAMRSLFFPWQEFWGGWLGGLIVLASILVCAYLTLSSIHQFKSLRFPVDYLLLLLASLSGFIWLNFHYFQAEGRYLLISWPAWVIVIGAGGRSVVRQWFLLGALLLPYVLFVAPFGEWANV